MQREESLVETLPAPIGEWVAAFNAHDLAAIVELYTDNAQLFDSGMRYPRRGRRAITRWFQTRFRTMPSLCYHPTGPLMVHKDSSGQLVEAALPWTTSGHGPRLAGQAWLARPFRVDGVSVFTLNEGRILQQHGYYDHLAVVQQIVPLLRWLLPVRF